MYSHLYRALMLISSVNYGISVPPEFCLHTLNKDDCNVPPQPVFSYYYPGSRCEIEYWRGCPTRNMFKDEVTCSSVCIYKMYKGAGGVKDTHALNEETDVNAGIILQKGKDICIEPYNNDDCGEPKQTKYYFAGDTCVRTDWTGCKSNNLFDDLPACIRACNPIIYFEPDVKDAIEDLTKEKLHDVDKLISHAIQEELKDVELPTLPSELAENETNKVLMDLYNITSADEFDNNNFTDDVDNDNVGTDVETLSAEQDNEADKLAAPDDSVEGSLEEVFTLS